jgi:hypothetical protein
MIMNQPFKITLPICVAAALIFCPLNTQAQTQPQIGTEVGQHYPDFLLPTLDGKPQRLSEYRGKKMLLFHFASW